MKQTLYKYMPVQSEAALERLVAVLKGWIYYFSPASFNDPFEMSAIFDAPGRDDVMALLKETRPLGDIHLSKSARSNIYRQVRSTLGTKRVVSRLWIESIGVLCLTTSADDLLMWAHYAQNHTSICLGFDSGCEPFSNAQPVCYQEGHARVDQLNTASREQRLVENVLFVKSPHWRYESEWRCIKRPVRDEEKTYYLDLYRQQPEKCDDIAKLLASEGGPGRYEFDVGALRRIYLGAAMKQDWKKRVAAAVNAYTPFVKLYVMSLDDRYFKLNAQKLRDRAFQFPSMGPTHGLLK